MTNIFFCFYDGTTECQNKIIESIKRKNQYVDELWIIKEIKVDMSELSNNIGSVYKLKEINSLTYNNRALFESINTVIKAISAIDSNAHFYIDLTTANPAEAFAASSLTDGQIVESYILSENLKETINMEPISSTGEFNKSRHKIIWFLYDNKEKNKGFSVPMIRANIKSIKSMKTIYNSIKWLNEKGYIIKSGENDECLCGKNAILYKITLHGEDYCKKHPRNMVLKK